MTQHTTTNCCHLHVVGNSHTHPVRPHIVHPPTHPLTRSARFAFCACRVLAICFMNNQRSKSSQSMCTPQNLVQIRSTCPSSTCTATHKKACPANRCHPSFQTASPLFVVLFFTSVQRLARSPAPPQRPLGVWTSRAHSRTRRPPRKAPTPLWKRRKPPTQHQISCTIVNILTVEWVVSLVRRPKQKVRTVEM